MSKTVIQTTHEMQEIPDDIDLSYAQSVCADGGNIEVVILPIGQLICDENALFNQSAVNWIASKLAGCPIFGRAILLTGGDEWE